MTILTILNTLAIIYIIAGRHLHFSCRKERVTFSQKLIGIRIYRNNRGFLYLPIRNRRKEELRLEIEMMMAGSRQNMVQRLNATFSWLRTQQQVDQFRKDYSLVDKELVESIASRFVPRAS